ncbi:hypothetical protein L1987_63812 [Smallanthus sonchifolius]|uniref:Uncharacterized protein n=1 Tax=Smallanthus sonchifolius TaxID=185202 RepID=A0ACB9CEB4_9ASTR|nr:hypothetical protein L1987_63812 [Smallanthus sonchifolius]
MVDGETERTKLSKKEAKPVATPAVKSIVPKPETSTAKPSSCKKRKITEPAKLSIQECNDFFDAHKKLHHFSHQALDKMVEFYSQLAKELDMCKQKLADSQKGEAAKGKKLLEVTKELNKTKAELQDTHLQHARDSEESNEQAKASATISIFQAMIKMAKEAEDKDFDRSAWDVEEWKRLVAELGGELVSEEDARKVVAKDEVQGSAKVAEEYKAVDAGKVVDQGSDGIDA